MFDVPVDGDDMVGMYFSEGHAGGVMVVGEGQQFLPHVSVQFAGLGGEGFTWKVEEEEVMCMLAGK